MQLHPVPSVMFMRRILLLQITQTLMNCISHRRCSSSFADFSMNQITSMVAAAISIR
jgi:hypothetical protein